MEPKMEPKATQALCADETRYGETIKFFADWAQDPTRRTGLDVQHTRTRADYPTLSLSIAPIRDVGTSPDWRAKLTVQLTRGELPMFCCVLLGLRKEAKGSHHGAAKNKGFAAYNNGASGVVIALSERGHQLQHFLGEAERMELAAFAIRQLACAWKIAPADAIALLRQIGSLG